MSEFDEMSDEEKKAYSEAIGYDVDAFELFKKQVVRPSDEEIALVAERLWADPVLGQAYRRVGLDGDLTLEEDEAVRAFIKAQQTGEMWDRRGADLWLATGLVRRRATGVLDDFLNDEARAFITNRRYPNPDGQSASLRVDTPVEEVFALVRTMLADEHIGALLRKKFDRNPPLEDEEAIADYTHRYARKHCLGNRSSLMGARVAGMIARGEATGFDDPKVIADLKWDRRIVWPEGGKA